MSKCERPIDEPAADTEVLTHLCYEWAMFCRTQRILQGGAVADRTVANALVESNAIHGRALIDFFYPEECFADNGWTSLRFNVDLGRSGDRPPPLRRWYKATSQLVAHLTPGRVTQVRELDHRKVAELLRGYIDQVRAKVGDAMPKDCGEEYPPLPPRIVPPPPGSFGSVGATGSTGPSK
jgi:hypothetical protein